jgi:hypothetical protein
MEIGECERLVQGDREKRGVLTRLEVDREKRDVLTSLAMASDLAASGMASLGMASRRRRRRWRWRLGMASLGMASLGMASGSGSLACVAPRLWHGVSLLPGCSLPS